MKKETTEAIVLYLTPFQDADAIITLFTPHFGLLKVLARKNGKGILQPLNLIELSFTRGRGEIHRCSEIALLSPHLSLRSSLPLLEAACQMAAALRTSQLPEKETPALYALFLALLTKLPDYPTPLIPPLFQLKILLHDGLWPFGAPCSLCGETPITAIDKEPFCRRHAPPLSLSFSPEEITHLNALAATKSLQNLALTPSLQAKIPLLFTNLLAGKTEYSA